MELVRRSPFLILILVVAGLSLSEGLECHSCESSAACFLNPGNTTVKCAEDQKYCVTGVHVYYINYAFRRCMSEAEWKCLEDSPYNHTRHFQDKKCMNMHKGSYDKCFRIYAPKSDPANCKGSNNGTTVSTSMPEATTTPGGRRRKRDDSEVTESSIQSAKNQNELSRQETGKSNTSLLLGFDDTPENKSIVSLCRCEADRCNNFAFSLAIWTSKTTTPLMTLCAALLGYMLAR